MDRHEPPCTDCITLPMCMKPLGDIIQDEDAVARMFAMSDLMHKCSIFKDYLYKLEKEIRKEETNEKHTNNG